jgi:protein-S-isoprenylcysteine O-methyltransferase Ste14
MPFPPDAIAEAAFLVVAGCWLGFGVILVVGKKAAAASFAKRDLKSHLGFALQGLSYAVLFIFSRPYFSPLIAMSQTNERILSLAVTAIAIGSDWFCFAAARALGKQWALVARVIEGHELVERGPYAVVRNPIYFAMLGMLVATGLAASRWQSLVAAVALFTIGTEIRIRSEEKLLREAFGPRFEEYARRVPAFFPRLW